ncbi:MAG: hypothetical protein P4L84_32975 [Isosphaeraceae bacterium]|nr:hypothetical protein [Isosphaeraceae bacterium]
MTRTGLLDTGATITAARPSVIDALKPIEIGEAEVTRSDGTAEWCPTYALQIAFEPNTQPEHWWLEGQWFGLEVVKASPANPGVDILIGRDLLSRVLFTWDGPKERFILSY